MRKLESVFTSLIRAGSSRDVVGLGRLYKRYQGAHIGSCLCTKLNARLLDLCGLRCCKSCWIQGCLLHSCNTCDGCLYFCCSLLCDKCHDWISGGLCSDGS